MDPGPPRVSGEGDDSLPERLPPELEEQFAEQKRKGISFTINWRAPRDADTFGEVTEIHWRPGEPNALAAAIIKDVHRPMRLSLDGHKFIIVPRDQYMPDDQKWS